MLVYYGRKLGAFSKFHAHLRDRAAFFNARSALPAQLLFSTLFS